MPQDVFELPGPEGNTIVGNLIDLSNDPLGFLSQCRDYGDIVPLRLELTPVWNRGFGNGVWHNLFFTKHWFESKRRQNFLVWEWFPRPENIRYRQAVAQMDEAIYNLIRYRRNQTEQTNDLLSMLMAARDEETGQQMDDKLLRDEVATLMLAGHENTTNALS